MSPARTFARSLTEVEAFHLPGAFDSVPEVENLAAMREHLRGTVPDPKRSIAHDYKQDLGSRPAQILQARPQATEDRVGVPEVSHQDTSHHRATAGRGLEAVLDLKEHARLDLPKALVVDWGQGHQAFFRALEAAAAAADLPAQIA